MSGAKAYYEAYWRAARPPAAADPLLGKRLEILWECVGAGDGTLLDAGSGAGDVVAAAQARGLDAVGLEISSAALLRARERHSDCTFVEHSVEDTPWPVVQGHFDTVVSFEVIEHLLEPRQLVEGAHSALKTGGHLALTTPYHGRLKNLAIALVAFEKHFDPLGDHVRFFTDAALRRLLDDTGFTTERIVHFGRAPGLWAGVFVWARKR